MIKEISINQWTWKTGNNAQSDS